MELIVRNLIKDNHGEVLLKNITYTFSSDKITGVIGSNELSLSTFFNVLSGLEEQDEGEVIFFDKNGREKVLSSYDFTNIFSDNYLPDFLTPYEFLEFYDDLYPNQADKNIDDYLDLIDVSVEDRHNVIRNASDCLKTKLSLVGLLISKPRVIFWDNPLPIKNAETIQIVKELLSDLTENSIVILGTNVSNIAEEFCDQILLLEKAEMSVIN